jgi:hypothetical protein
MSSDVGPVLGEDPSRIVVDLHLPQAPHPGSLKPQVEAADAAEQ